MASSFPPHLHSSSRLPRTRALSCVVEDTDIVRERAARMRDRNKEPAHAFGELGQVVRGDVWSQYGVHVGGVKDDDIAPLAGGC